MNREEAFAAVCRGEEVEVCHKGIWIDIVPATSLYIFLDDDYSYRLKQKPHPLEGLPVDTRIRIKDVGVRLFKNVGEDGHIATSTSPEGVLLSNFGMHRMCNVCGIVDNPWKHWFGGERPVPGWVKVEVRLKYETYRGAMRADSYNWSWEYDEEDILGYKIVEQDLP